MKNVYIVGSVVLLIVVAALFPAAILWFLWTFLGYGAHYFNFLPVQFHTVPFLDCFVLIIIVGFLGKLVTGKDIVNVSKRN